MSRAAHAEHVRIVGAGRLGLALGSLLHEAGVAASLTYIGRAANPPDHPLFSGPEPAARYRAGPVPPEPRTTALLLAVSDAGLGVVAAELAEGGVPEGMAALHFSGTLGTEPLEPLAAAGASVGTAHPLAAVPDGDSGAERLRGAAWGVEASGAALRLARRIVAAAGGSILPIASGAKPLYHAAAVLASNYVVTLLAEAESAMQRAGIPAEAARSALTRLAAGVVADVRARGPAAALTGPVARGDVQTVRIHLARLSRQERRVYCALGARTTALARGAGLDPVVAAELEDLFRGEP